MYENLKWFRSIRTVVCTSRTCCTELVRKIYFWRILYKRLLLRRKIISLEMCYIGYTSRGLQYEVSESGIRSMLFHRQGIPTNILVLHTEYICQLVYCGLLQKLLLANKICNTNINISVLPAYASDARVPGLLFVDHILHGYLLLNVKRSLAGSDVVDVREGRKDRHPYR